MLVTQIETFDGVHKGFRSPQLIAAQFFIPFHKRCQKGSKDTRPLWQQTCE